MSKARSTTDAGFTLIELLVVITLIGVLIAISVLSVGKFRTNATKKACISDVLTIQLALDAYKTKFGVFAPTQQALASGGVLSKQTGNNNIEDADGYDIAYATGSPYTLTITRTGQAPKTLTAADTASKSAISTACS
jgi:prepilin-type N-terminal cleavage/methylation domain-containing protein